VVEEMLDFDQAIGEALEFASKDKETLVIVTADHETGGMAILEGNPETGMVKGEFTTGGHTGLMVPVFAYGPGAEEFIGFLDNTDINKKIKELIINN
jgi:alkaline phosphatase